MARFNIWVVLVVLSYHASANTDPFQAGTVPRQKRIRMLAKYQYLGYIKGPSLSWAFVRPAGGDILRVIKGKSFGLGKVVDFGQDNICIMHHKRRYCLKRAAQVMNWVQDEAIA